MFSDADTAPLSPEAAADNDDVGALTTWQPIFHASNQVVLYNPTSHAIAIRTSSIQPQERHCPYCKQTVPPAFHSEPEIHDNDFDDDYTQSHSRASNYFHLLAIANDTWSRPSTPPSPIAPGDNAEAGPSTFSRDSLAHGYFKTFFTEEQKLGMGANGSVYLCQHVLDGNPLGHFAVKKVAVGQSHSYLMNILREVRLLERLHHPNIITYHHSWLETTQFSSFGPKVPTLHILMQWAEGGSLDDFIDVRLGRETHAHISPSSPGANSDPDLLSRSARIRAYKMYQRASPEEKERLRRRMDGGASSKYRQTWTAVHLLSPEEAKSLFGDVVEGLAFLHAKSILHLDLKPGNVLLTWDEGRLIPRAMLSDFGTSRDMLNSSNVRTGNTGTLEYSSPESLPSPQTGALRTIDSKSDMWSLGMILHKLLFFKLPYHYAAAGDASGSTVNSLAEDDKMSRLEAEVLSYPGFKTTPTVSASFEARHLPHAFLILLESLLNPTPASRPPCERVLSALREGRLDPVPPRTRRSATPMSTSLMPIVRRHSSADSAERAPAPTPTAPVEAPVEAPTREPSPEPQLDDAVDEKTNLLLPAPDTRLPASKTSLVLGSGLLKRSLKSFILVFKIMNISSICSSGTLGTITLIVVVFLAIVDTWFEDLGSSVVLSLVHVLIVKVACRNDRCCDL